VAEWLRRGLQILEWGFDSLRGLHCCCLVHVKPIRAAMPGKRRFNHPTDLTVATRRNRRMGGKSIDRISSPSGSIQKPRIGRKPRNPPKRHKMPKPTRKNMLPGTRTRLPKKFTVFKAQQLPCNFPAIWCCPALNQGIFNLAQHLRENA
jgi:hypothetical protein